MNKVNLVGRITKDLTLKYTRDTNNAIVRFTLAVNRRKKNEADFISCVAFGRTAELMAQYCHQGTRIGATGRIQTGSYEKDGAKHFTTDVVVEEMEFLESKQSGEQTAETQSDTDGFVNIPDGVDDDGLPF